MNSNIIGRARFFYLVLLAALAAPASAFSQYLLDTGPAGTTSIGGAALFASGSTTCSPQPACAAHFQLLAVRLVLPEAATVSSLELWVAPFGKGGSMDVKIREEVNGLPSTSAPPLFSPNSIYSKRYTGLPNIGGLAQWIPFTDYEAVLAAGTYWVTFEPVHASGLNYSVPNGAANPAPKYAYFGDGNPGYLNLTPASFGVRVGGTVFPGVAFGTATRVISDGGTAPCCPFSYDSVQEGTRDFTRLGTQGPPLTSSYIFVLGYSHIHGHGRIVSTANGLSVGAYASNSSYANGAGRGIAYRTFVNMSDQPRSFRANANLHGAFHHTGGLARAGIYVFDTALFSSTLQSSTKTAGHFLLDADGKNAIASQFTDISPARFFPAGALLAQDQETAVFPLGVATTVPMQTGLVTVQPGETVTVLFDVAVFAPIEGQADFGNTLSSAPVFLTDANGNAVADVVAVGPASVSAGPVATLAATPASSSTPIGTPGAVTATARTAGGAAVPDTDVTFTVLSGPNAGGSPSVVKTDVNGEAVFSYVGSILGSDTVQASIGTLQSNSVTNTWVAGAVERIEITPENATLPIGTGQAFTVAAFDAFSNSLGDVTGATSFTIGPDGSCIGATCTAPTAGPHIVTATYNGKTHEAALTFTAAGGYTFTGFFQPVDNLPVVNTVKPGSSVPLIFSLSGNQGLDIFAPGYPLSQTVACVGGVTEDALEQTATAGASGLSYDASSDRYSYIWKTDKSWGGKCRQLIVKLKDSSSYMASFKFK